MTQRGRTIGALTGICASFGTAMLAWPGTVTRIISTSYLPHGFCYLWNRELLALHVVSDSTIWISYLVIAITLGYVVYRHRHQVPFTGILIAFGAFIITCGFTHFMDVVVLWTPLYWLSGDVKLITAVASVATAIALLGLVPGIGQAIQDVATSRSNERRFLAASNSSLDAFYILEAVRNPAGEITDFRFTFTNENGAALLLGTPDKIVGQLLCVAYPINVSGGFFDKYKRVVETGETIVDEFEIQSPMVAASWLRYQVVKLDDGVAVTSSNVTDRQLNYLRTQSALREKDVLLGEIHHRVKNNLQIVHSLLELQCAQIDEPLTCSMLRDSQNRIRSMALIHQTLYQSNDFGQVDFGMFLRTLVPTLVGSYLKDPERVVFAIRADNMLLPIDRAIPCGLIVNELVSNALKHAFPGDRRGRIDIEFAPGDGDEVALCVSDNGAGIPESFDLEKSTSLGMQLVFLLTDQVGGKTTLQRSNPTSFMLRFPVYHHPLTPPDAVATSSQASSICV